MADCDFETFKINKKLRSRKKASIKSDDLPSIFSDLFSSINYKMAIFLFILGIMIFSDVFIDLFLTSIPGAVYGDVTTNKGTIIQLLCLVFSYIIVDLMITGEII